MVALHTHGRTKFKFQIKVPSELLMLERLAASAEPMNHGGELIIESFNLLATGKFFSWILIKDKVVHRST